MSLSYLRDNITRRLQDRADAASSNAINMRVRPASGDIPAMSCEEYALSQVDSLTTARVYLEAIRVVTEEYTRLTQPEKAAEEKQKVTPLKAGSVY